MPEAPEVENVIRYLKNQLQGLRIEKVKILYPKLSEPMDPADFEKGLEGERLLSFARHGKYLIFQTNHLEWISHLRMEGSFRIEPAPFDHSRIGKHDHALFFLEDDRVLVYRDTRKFGRMRLFERNLPLEEHPIFSRMGMDVLDTRWNADAFYALSSKSRRAIKTFLLDQKIVAGIGNIYANEILFEARIHPARSASSLDLEDCARIVQAMQSIIARAIELKGTTIRTFRYDGAQHGGFQQLLKVHEQKRCKVCNHEIERIVINQRSSYLCPRCQTLSE